MREISSAVIESPNAVIEESGHVSGFDYSLLSFSIDFCESEVGVQQIYPFMKSGNIVYALQPRGTIIESRQAIFDFVANSLPVASVPGVVEVIRV